MTFDSTIRAGISASDIYFDNCGNAKVDDRHFFKKFFSSPADKDKRKTDLFQRAIKRANCTNRGALTESGIKIVTSLASMPDFFNKSNELIKCYVTTPTGMKNFISICKCQASLPMSARKSLADAQPHLLNYVCKYLDEEVIDKNSNFTDSELRNAYETALDDLNCDGVIDKEKLRERLEKYIDAKNKMNNLISNIDYGKTFIELQNDVNTIMNESDSWPKFIKFYLYEALINSYCEKRDIIDIASAKAIDSLIGLHHILTGEQFKANENTKNKIDSVIATTQS